MTNLAAAIKYAVNTRSPREIEKVAAAMRRVAEWDELLWWLQKVLSLWQ